jgi:hypothetical protein
MWATGLCVYAATPRRSYEGDPSKGKLNMYGNSSGRKPSLEEIARAIGGDVLAVK